MKLCIDCKHFQIPADIPDPVHGTSDMKYATCAVCTDVSMVDGTTKQLFCSAARIGKCGEEARRFEAKA